MDNRQRWNIIWNLLLDSVWRTKLSKLIGGAAVIASISGYTIKEIFKDSTVFDWLNWSYTVCIGLLILIFRILYIAAREINEAKFSKSASYTPLKMTRNIKELMVNCDNVITENITADQALALLCNKLRDIVDKLTNTRCCVSIKLIEGNEDGSFIMKVDDIINHKVHNVARDNNHGGRDTKAYQNAEHFIRANTAFSTIVGTLETKPKRYYLNNKVDPSNSYETSSPYTSSENGLIDIPYKSEVVFPIMDKADNDKYKFIGFLCIDSENEYAFDKDSPFLEIASMVANSLFWILQK